MTYQPKTEAGRFVLETGMMVAASEPDGGCINWEAIVQDMEEDAAKLERERLRALVKAHTESVPYCPSASEMYEFLEEPQR